MNNPNPFLPQGVFIDQKNKARTRLKIAVLSSISLMSVMVLAALFIQGCKKPSESTDNSSGTGNDSLSNTQQLASSQPETNTSNTTIAPLSNPTPAESNVSPIVNTPQPIATPQPITTPPPPVPEMQEYTIVKGDKLSTIAGNNHVSLPALMNANPGIDPKKLKIGQKIKIPAAASASSAVSTPSVGSAAPVDAAAAGGAITYKVKSGDTLTLLQKRFHVSIKAIQSANNLSTTRLNVGQVLKIPGAAAPAPAQEAAPVPSPAASPAPCFTSVSNGAPAPMR